MKCYLCYSAFEALNYAYFTVFVTMSYYFNAYLH